MTAKHTIRISIILAIIFLLLSLVVAETTLGDLLLYTEGSSDYPITVYNPSTGETIQLPIQTEINSILTSQDGRIAYIQDNDVWVLDVLNAPEEPVQITHTPNEEKYLLNWTSSGELLHFVTPYTLGSETLLTYNGQDVVAVDHILNRSPRNLSLNEDGWYIAFREDDQGEQGWYVWNGQTHIRLELSELSDEPAWERFQWTANNHLFITIGYQQQEYMEPIGPTQVFYWNGLTVQEVPRPSDDETFMIGEWSHKGQLTFYTDREYTRRWYVWDGVSFTTEGVPDLSTALALNQSSERISDIDWMPDGRLAISAWCNAESNTLLRHPYECANPWGAQVYLWDENHLVQITDNDHLGLIVAVHESGMLTVSETNGMVFSGITVFNNNLETVFRVNGIYTSSRWSADGNLAYCNGNSLFVWDGYQSVELMASFSVYSKWLFAPSSSPMVCTTG